MTEFQERLARVRAFMSEQGAGAFLITRQSNFAWFTGGARGFVALATEGAVGQILILPDRTVLITNNIEAGRLAEEELGNAELEVVSVPWHDDAKAGQTLRSLVGDAALCADFPAAGARHLPAFDQLRWTLSLPEQERARKLGKEVAEATEAVARDFRHNETELEVAGRLARAFWSRGIEPTVLLVGGDERAFRYRHPLPTATPVSRYGMLVVCGRRHGLVMSATRLVHFGQPPSELLRRLEVAAAVDAAMIGATRPGATAGTIFAAGQAAYAAGGFPSEWQYHHQGGMAGYLGREYRGLPGGAQVVQAGQIFAWNPTVQGAKSEDTVLVGEPANEVLTYTGRWPEGPHGRPGILVR